MKRCWMVCVEAGGVGHELHDVISEAEFYGPYTEELAERIANEFNSVMRHSSDSEAPIATAMPLTQSTQKDMRRKAVALLDEKLDQESTEPEPSS